MPNGNYIVTVSYNQNFDLKKEEIMGNNFPMSIAYMSR